MLNIQQLLVDNFVAGIKQAYTQMYGDLESTYVSVLEWAGRLALENISNSDMLYHDVEHTVMVTMAGQAILKGKHLSEGGVSPRDWLHFTLATLCHDIGYVRGVCKQDDGNVVASGVDGGTIEIVPTGTDVVLTPHHVDRSKLFVRERFGGSQLVDIDVDRIADYIEMTRFPIPDDEFHQDTTSLRAMLRSADLIGQLGDPGYLRKLPALYYEFHELGTLDNIGCSSPTEMRHNYSGFYWNVVRPYVTDALRYLRITQEGKAWVANMHNHVFDVEHREV